MISVLPAPVKSPVQEGSSEMFPKPVVPMMVQPSSFTEKVPSHQWLSLGEKNMISVLPAPVKSPVQKRKAEMFPKPRVLPAKDQSRNNLSMTLDVRAEPFTNTEIVEPINTF